VSDLLLDRQVRRRLAVLRHAEEVTGNVALTCRYFGISRQLYYTWQRRYQSDRLEGLRPRSRRPKTSPGGVRDPAGAEFAYYLSCDGLVRSA